MPYTVLSNTHKEISEGAGFMSVHLGDLLIKKMMGIAQTGQLPRKRCEVEVYFFNRFINPHEFDTLFHRFGGDGKNIQNFVFLNECAVEACTHHNIQIKPIGQLEQLPNGLGTLLGGIPLV